MTEATEASFSGAPALAPRRRFAPPRWALIAALMVAVLGVFVGGVQAYEAATGEFATVQAGVLYRSSQMTPERLVRVCQKYSIRTVVDLRQEFEVGTRAEAAALEKAGVHYVNLPSPQLPPPDVVERFRAIVKDASSQPVLVHCHHGIGRTGLIAAIYRVENQGWSWWGAMWEARGIAGFFDGNSPKNEYLRQYVTKRPANA